MSTIPATTGERFTITHWLIVIVASIGFLFDTYELLMFPVIARDTLAELLKKPPTSPEVAFWTGRLLWYAALSGGIFGLLGGWLIDRFGRKTVMVGSHGLLVFARLAVFSTDVWMFVLFRCTTFVGVCVEFVAAVTWLAELFPDKRSANWCSAGLWHFLRSAASSSRKCTTRLAICVNRCLRSRLEKVSILMQPGAIRF